MACRWREFYYDILDDGQGCIDDILAGFKALG